MTRSLLVRFGGRVKTGPPPRRAPPWPLPGAEAQEDAARSHAHGGEEGKGAEQQAKVEHIRLCIFYLVVGLFLD